MEPTSLAPDPMEVVRRFLRLGVSRRVASVYVWLLENSPRTVQQVSVRCRLTPQDALSIIEELARLRLITSDNYHGATIWFAVDPQVSWRALRDEITWAKVNVLGSTLSPAQEQSVDGNVLSLRSMCEELERLSSALYRPYLPDLWGHARDSKDSDDLAMMECLAIQTARRKIVSVSPSPRLPHLAPIWNSLLAARSRGVQYWRITDLIEVREHGLAIVTRDMDDVGVRLSLVEHHRLRHRFYAVDGVLAVIYHRQPGDMEHRLLGKLTGQVHEVRRYEKRFEQYLIESIPGHFVVDQLRQVSGLLVDRCETRYGAFGKEWMERVIDMGIFAQFTGLSPQEQRRVTDIEDWATASGIVERGSRDRLVPMYPLDEHAIRAAWRSAQESGSAEPDVG